MHRVSAAAKKENTISVGIFINRFKPGYLRGRVQQELNQGIRLQSKDERKNRDGISGVWIDSGSLAWALQTNRPVLSILRDATQTVPFHAPIL